MHFLRGTKLHAGYDCQADFFTDLKSGTAILSGVVIGQGNGVHAENLCHINKVIRRHILIAAWRKTRMKMKIIV